jgi:methylenetetrahydrofolate dehydrogenase (NADP+)/methenyltetrahydrofolate cyclohydrolase
MTKILDAKSIINSKLPNLKELSCSLAIKGLKPKLSVILVGKNPASIIYIGNKKKHCEKISADFELIELPASVDEEKFLSEVDRLNNDPTVTGCFVQLPIPKHLQHINITQLINPLKDVDGFHLNTINDLYLGHLSGIIPCTPKGIVTLLKENNIELAGKNITILGRSSIVGKPLALLLNSYNATITMCHAKTEGIEKHTQNADIIISAVGVPHLIKRRHLNTSKKQIIIDVGMNKLNGITVGDVDYNEVFDHVAAISPVPGGVGPMTVFSLMENLLMTTENILKERQ